MKMRSHVAGTIKLDPSEHIDRKVYRFMGDAAAYAYLLCVKRLKIQV